MATTPAPVCPDLPEPTGGSVSYNRAGSTNNRPVGAIAVLSCTTGYVQSGGSTFRVCQSTGLWSGSQLVCGQWLNLSSIIVFTVLSLYTQFVTVALHPLLLMELLVPLPVHYKEEQSPTLVLLVMRCQDHLQWLVRLMGCGVHYQLVQVCLYNGIVIILIYFSPCSLLPRPPSPH